MLLRRRTRRITTHRVPDPASATSRVGGDRGTLKCMWHEDLSGDDPIRYIGYLDADHPFPTGPTPDEFLTKLDACMAAELVLPHAVAAGVHECELCQRGPANASGVVVPGDGVLYQAPSMIVHYINVHWYLPPQPFIDAVMQCPSPGTQAHRIALLDNGGRTLIQSGRVIFL